MRANLENPRVYSPKLFGPSIGSMTYAMTGTFVVPSDGPGVFILDAGGADKTVRLPASSIENQVVLANVGTAGSLNVTNSAGIAQVTIPPQTVAMFFGSPSRWVWLLASLSAAISGPTVVMVSQAIAVTDTVVQTNQAGAIVLTLPASASWAAAQAGRGTPLTIFDISGTASTNTVTINPNGAETISGLASLVIGTDYGGFRLEPKSGGGWVVI
jgi:hypothetical protein